MHPIAVLLDMILSLYSWVVLIYVLIQLLSFFNIVNINQPFVFRLNRILADLTEPALRRIRIYLKPINGFDISPVILLMAIHFLSYCLHYYF
jgi:YggT family protein